MPSCFNMSVSAFLRIHLRIMNDNDVLTARDTFRFYHYLAYIHQYPLFQIFNLNMSTISIGQSLTFSLNYLHERIEQELTPLQGKDRRPLKDWVNVILVRGDADAGRWAAAYQYMFATELLKEFGSEVFFIWAMSYWPKDTPVNHKTTIDEIRDWAQLNTSFHPQLTKLAAGYFSTGPPKDWLSNYVRRDSETPQTILRNIDLAEDQVQPIMRSILGYCELAQPFRAQSYLTHAKLPRNQAYSHAWATDSPPTYHIVGTDEVLTAHLVNPSQWPLLVPSDSPTGRRFFREGAISLEMSKPRDSGTVASLAAATRQKTLVSPSQGSRRLQFITFETGATQQAYPISRLNLMSQQSTRPTANRAILIVENEFIRGQRLEVGVCRYLTCLSGSKIVCYQSISGEDQSMWGMDPLEIRYSRPWSMLVIEPGDTL